MSYEAWGDNDDSPFEAAIEAGWIDPTDQSKALIDVMNERDRQQNEKGWSPEHDDLYVDGELTAAAACYVLHGGGWQNKVLSPLSVLWPWSTKWWKPTNPRRDLVKAAALILAEIERLDRIEDAQARAALAGLRP